jgi:hypothetical protein
MLRKKETLHNSWGFEQTNKIKAVGGVSPHQFKKKIFVWLLL